MFNNQAEIDAAFEGLLEKGLIEACGVNEEGDIVYQLTESGRKIFE